jgi:hypothetical protein
VTLTDVQADISVAKIKSQLAKQDHDDAIKGSIDFSNMNVTPSSFIATGLELEELQYVHRIYIYCSLIWLALECPSDISNR